MNAYRACTPRSFHGRLASIKPPGPGYGILYRGFHCAVRDRGGDDVQRITFLPRSYARRSHSLRHSRLLMGSRAAVATSFTQQKSVHGADASSSLVKYDAYLLIRSKLYPHYLTRDPSRPLLFPWNRDPSFAIQYYGLLTPTLLCAVWNCRFVGKFSN